MQQQQLLLLLLASLALTLSVLAAGPALGELDQVYFGVWVDPDLGFQDTPALFNSRLQRNASVFHIAQRMPLPPYNYTTGVGGPAPEYLVELLGADAGAADGAQPAGDGAADAVWGQAAQRRGQAAHGALPRLGGRRDVQLAARLGLARSLPQKGTWQETSRPLSCPLTPFSFTLLPCHGLSTSSSAYDPFFFLRSNLLLRRFLAPSSPSHHRFV